MVRLVCELPLPKRPFEVPFWVDDVPVVCGEPRPLDAAPLSVGFDLELEKLLRVPLDVDAGLRGNGCRCCWEAGFR